MRIMRDVDFAALEPCWALYFYIPEHIERGRPRARLMLEAPGDISSINTPLIFPFAYMYTLLEFAAYRLCHAKRWASGSLLRLIARDAALDAYTMMHFSALLRHILPLARTPAALIGRIHETRRR